MGASLAAALTILLLHSSSLLAQAVRVAVVSPEKATIKRVVDQPAEVEAYETTPIHAKVAGYVKSVAVDIGDRVKAGQVLAELFMPELVADVASARALVEQKEAERLQAEAAVTVARAQLDSSNATVAETRARIGRMQAELSRWEAEYTRIDQLVRQSALTPSLRDETRSKLQSAQAMVEETNAQVRTSEAAVREAEAAIEKARADVTAAAARIAVARFDLERADALLGYTKLTAPYDAIVVRRQVDPGRLTRGGADDQALLEIARIDPITVVVGVPEIESARIDPGDPVQLRIPALGGAAIKATVTRTSWSLDTSNRTLRVEVDLPNPDAKLRPGLYCYATITEEERADALSLPVAAVVEAADQTYCVVIDNGRAVRRPLELGLSDGTRVEILGGLKGGETVVAANPSILTEGQALQALPPAAPKP